MARIRVDFPAFGAMNRPIAVVDGGIDFAVGNAPDAAASPAVAAVGTAAGNILLAPEGNHSVAAVAGDDFDDRFIDEFHRAGAALARTNNRKRSVSSPRRRPSQTLSQAESGGSADSLPATWTSNAEHRLEAGKSSRTVIRPRK